MGRKKVWPPTRYTHSCGQEYIKVCGKTIYLGPADSEQAQKRFNDLVKQIESNGGILPEPSFDLQQSVADLSLRYWELQEPARRRVDGNRSQEMKCIKYALRPLVHLLGTMPAVDVAPRHLRAVRQLMIDGYEHNELGPQARQCRFTINKNFRRVRAVFRWAADEGMIPAELYHRLSLIRGLRVGESGVRESAPVLPVPEKDLGASMAEMSPIIRAMVEVQLLCGCRAGEIIRLCPGDVDQSDAVWRWTLTDHKNAWRGLRRVIFLGPNAQAILRPYLERDASLPCFSPKEATAGAVPRRDGKTPKDAYSIFSYEKAILRACKRAKVKAWSPSRLRHNAATRLVSEFGWDVARIVLGHRNIETTRIYAADDLGKAEKAIRKCG